MKRFCFKYLSISYSKYLSISFESSGICPHYELLPSLPAPSEAKAQTGFHYSDLYWASNLHSFFRLVRTSNLHPFQILPISTCVGLTVTFCARHFCLDPLQFDSGNLFGFLCLHFCSYFFFIWCIASQADDILLTSTGLGLSVAAWWWRHWSEIWVPIVLFKEDHRKTE